MDEGGDLRFENVGSKRDLARVLRAGSKTAKKMTEIRCERGDVLVQSARILAVADIVEAMTAERPYRAAMPAEQALALTRDDVGTKLCPDAFAALSGALPAPLAA